MKLHDITGNILVFFMICIQAKRKISQC